MPHEPPQEPFFSTLAATPKASRTTGHDEERTLFAFRIPFLPDSLSNPNLSGTSDRDRLTEVLDQHVRLVSNMAKWKGGALGLRFLSRPERGQVELLLAGRTQGTPGQSRATATHMAQDIVALFAGYGFLIEPVTDEAELTAVLDPFEGQSHVVEIRQQEDLIHMQAGDAYVVYPFSRPLHSTLISFFEMMLRQPEGCLVQVYLEPTELSPAERMRLTDAAFTAANLADFQYEGLYYSGRQLDPQADLVARLYRNCLERYNDPFLMCVQVTSPNRGVAETIAQAFGAEITESVGLGRALKDQATLPSGFGLTEPLTVSETEAAYESLRFLSLQFWGRTRATFGKERLRYLVDAPTAAGAFRLPVALKGGIPGVPTKQTAPQFDTGLRQMTLGPDEIQVGRFSDRSGAVGVSLRHLTRHMLIVGTNGSGKTTTCFHLLTQLWDRGIPFLVIEPAKTEYRALLDAPLGQEVQVFTLGDESTSPFRFNPLEIQPGVRVEAHIAQLQGCLEAALPTFGALPSLISECLERVYLNKNWNLSDRGQANDTRLMPTLGEFYFEMIRTIEGRDYSDKTLQDIRAAATGRIGSLLRGSKGRMLNTQRSIPMLDLMSRPTVLELESLNDEEKALVMMLLLLAVREHCQTTRTNSQLQHVTLIEEAHRVMAKTAHTGNREVSGDAKAEAVAAFSAALAEIRAYGEGLIVADQVPGRLVDDAMKNTNTKIVHRLPGEDDRRSTAATMNMGPEQEAFVAKLKQGEAAFFAEGYEKPVFISVPNYRADHELPERVPEARVEAHMQRRQEASPQMLLPFPGCEHCLRQCVYRDRVGGVAYNVDAHKAFRKALRDYGEQRKTDEKSAWSNLAAHCRAAVAGAGLAGDSHAAYCYFAHQYSGKPGAAAARRIRGDS